MFACYTCMLWFFLQFCCLNDFFTIQNLCLILLTVDLRTIGISNSPIIVDQSPPVAGVVYDGDHSGEDLVYMKDNNKVTDLIRFISTMRYIQLFLQLSYFRFFFFVIPFILLKNTICRNFIQLCLPWEILNCKNDWCK